MKHLQNYITEIIRKIVLINFYLHAKFYKITEVAFWTVFLITMANHGIHQG